MSLRVVSAFVKVVEKETAGTLSGTRALAELSILADEMTSSNTPIGFFLNYFGTLGRT